MQLFRHFMAIIWVMPLAACVTDRRPPPDIPAMVRLAPGRFIAGSTSAETDAVHYPALNASREQPARPVTVARAFAISRTEVTRGQFGRFVGATGWQPDGPCSFLIDGPPNRWEADAAHDWQHPGFVQTDTHPVVCVNVADAEAYAVWLSGVTGRRFRLPSNTEWEYAVRAGTTSAVYWGDRPPGAACVFANVLDASNARAHNQGVADPEQTFPCDDRYSDTAPVGSFRPNRWGLYDMIGNVWELTRDCLAASQAGAPADTKARTDGDCASHIDRGASWTNTRKYVRDRCGDNPRPYAANAPLRLAALTLDDPRPGELLIRIDAAGLCHSDLSVVNGDRPRPMPMAIGHEATGIVEALGSPDDARFAIGDRVVLAFLPACGDCVRCQSGEGYMCPNGAAANGEGRLLGGGCRLHEGKTRVHHHLGVSAFASHAVVDRRSAVKIDADIPPEIAALFGCAVLTGVGAVMNSAALRPGESMALYGLGGVGLAALLGGLVSGAVPIVAIDPSPAKRAIAERLGAIAAHPAEAAETIAHTIPGGADVVIETVGKAAVLGEAYRAARRGGRVVTVGLPNPAERLDIPAVSLVGEGKTLIGSYMGSSIPARDIPRYIALWRAGRLPVEELLTSISPLGDINQLLDALADGGAIRQIVRP